jgi:hypothetical protein
MYNEIADTVLCKRRLKLKRLPGNKMAWQMMRGKQAAVVRSYHEISLEPHDVE